MPSPTEAKHDPIASTDAELITALSQQQYRRVQQQKRVAQLVELKAQGGVQGQSIPETRSSFTSRQASTSGGNLLRRERTHLEFKVPNKERYSQVPTVDRLAGKYFLSTNPTEAGLLQQQTA